MIIPAILTSCSSSKNTKTIPRPQHEPFVHQREQDRSIRLIKHHGKRKYDLIYKEYLNFKSIRDIKKYIEENPTHTLYFIESFAFLDREKSFDAFYSIAKDVVTDKNISAALDLNRDAWKECREIYLKATQVYMKTKLSATINRFKDICPPLRDIY
ncbi:MAG: hypothetical protein OET90_04860 [Desulfuromonadales bacterium]|nr:hypothetical protein [Desulfuromonadales bacterium]